MKSIAKIFAFIVHTAVNFFRYKRQYSGFLRPSVFDYDLIVIGGGAAGLAAAQSSAHLKARTLLVEESRLGANCLYSGCIPSKSLMRSAQIAQIFRRGNEFGLQMAAPQVDFSRVFTRIHNTIKKIEPSVSNEKLEKLGVDIISGVAKVADPFRVHIGERIMTTRNIIIATGATPVVPEIPGLRDVPHFTSQTLWQMSWVPKKLLILGGDSVGCEMAQAFCRLGCETILIEQRNRLLRHEDSDVAELILRKLKSEGVKMFLDSKITRFERHGNGGTAWLDSSESISFDALVIALGRKPNTNNICLSGFELKNRHDGSLETDKYMRTKYPNIFACGDVTGPLQFTHAAAYQARHAVENALHAPFLSAVDYLSVPWCTQLDPEVGRIGINETMAREFGIEFDVYKYDLARLDRAICDGNELGFIKVITPKKSGKILGVTSVGVHAGEGLAEFALAIRHGLTLEDVLSSPHAYPTYSEANLMVGLTWKRKFKHRKS